jgi:two-component system cell cycle sensor histidine kinase PleC
MSHEFRTPLNAILGFSEVLAQERFGPIGTPKYREYADDILVSGQHLRSLIDDVLDMAKIEAGTVQADIQWFDLSSVVADVGRIIQGRTGAAGQCFRVESPDTPVWIESDPRLLRQVLLNLLSNATKFTPAGGEIRLTLSHPGDHVHLSVVDTGIGMSGEELATARQPFGQTERGKAQGHAGTGLGLPICNSLVTLLGGNLAIDSSPQHGTQVDVVLPAAALASNPRQRFEADAERFDAAAADRASAA